ncbi:MAG: WYL domain-containing protein [Caldilinea sp.]|nr:WYL domain-containing protein [Caldilinea sp.]MCB9122166.1 WYL domain-containing protein [Caldilineaceae bacterium]MCO5212015.1 WYL domain-containing protein [Caldilinea sp.]MCW5841749.1 WYL domain-containing protein [Caldilinea sp.]
MAEKPDYREMQRSLSILRRLQIGPATRAILIEHVRVDNGADAYDEEERRAEKRFAKDIDRLRTWGIEIAIDTGYEYRLVSYGAFSPVYLNDAELGAVALLMETFAPGVPESEAVQQLLRRVLDWAPAKQRSEVTHKRQRLRIDLRRKDDDFVPQAVQEAVAKAHDTRRRLRFFYLSPGQADGIPREHTVEPWYLHYDTIGRHVYLDAYRLSVTGPHGTWPEGRWQRYRLGRIQADGITVLPDKLPPTPPKRATYAVEYLLAPEIARRGEVSLHFDRMEIGTADETGWVRVTGTTDNPFTAVQLFLGYGARCRVLGGPEIRQAMEENVAALAEFYTAPLEQGEPLCED